MSGYFQPSFYAKPNRIRIRKVVVLSDKQIRKQNLRQLRSEYGKSFRRALAEQGLTPEEFSAQSEIPLNVVEEHLNGQRRFLGEINNICFCLNKRMKIELVD